MAKRRNSGSRSTSPKNRKRARHNSTDASSFFGMQMPNAPIQNRGPSPKSSSKSPSDGSLFGRPSESPEAPEQIQASCFELPNAAIQGQGQPEMQYSQTVAAEASPGPEQDTDQLMLDLQLEMYIEKVISESYTLEQVEKDVREGVIPDRVVPELRRRGFFPLQEVNAPSTPPEIIQDQPQEESPASKLLREAAEWADLDALHQWHLANPTDGGQPSSVPVMPQPMQEPIPVNPNGFNYYRFNTLAPAQRVPHLQFSEEDGSLQRIEYEFSDEDDVPDTHFANKPEIYLDELLQDYKVPNLEMIWEDGREARRDFFREGVRTDLEVPRLVEIGLAMNRLYRIYRNGCAKGRAPTGWMKNDRQGCKATAEWPTKEGEQKKRIDAQRRKTAATRKRRGLPTGELKKKKKKKKRKTKKWGDLALPSSSEDDNEVEVIENAGGGGVNEPYEDDSYGEDPEMFPDAGMRASKTPLEQRGLKALFSRRHRVRDALNKIPVLLRINPADVESSDRKTVEDQMVLQNAVADAMSRHPTFEEGFEVPCAADLQTMTRICLFADARWQTPTWEYDAHEQQDVWVV